MINNLLLVLGYAFLGGGIKYIDQAYDIGVFSRVAAKFVAIACGLVMGYLIVTDVPSSMIFMAMVVSLALTRKIDNVSFYIGTGIVIILPILFNGKLELLWFPFGVLLLSGIVDEIGNDWADKSYKKRRKNAIKNGTDTMEYRIREKFGMHRFMMKLAVIGLVLFNYFPPIYLIAFIVFDSIYETVGWYSESIKVYNIKKELVSN